MSVQITIGKNQGITQAIRDKIAASEDVKNTDLKTWQEVVKLVEGNSQSIFKKDNNNGTQFTTDRTKINDKSSNHSNYVVDQGTVNIDKGIWDKIKDLLTGSKTEKTQDEAKLKKLEPPPPADLTQNPVDLNAKVESKIDTDNINIPVVATGKQLTRSVNGTQQKIEIQNVNGQKVRFAVNDDGTRGEQLVPISTAGKNKYITKSQFDLNVRTALGLDSNVPIPPSDMLTCAYESDGMISSLVFRDKDGQQINGKKLKTMIDEYKSSLENNSQSANTKPKIEDCSALDAKGLKKYMKANNNKKIRFDGKTYTIEGEYLKHQNLYISAEYLINKKATNTKTMQAQAKHSNLNFDNDAPSSS